MYSSYNSKFWLILGLFCHPQNENLNLLVWINPWIYFHIILNKNWKFCRSLDRGPVLIVRNFFFFIEQNSKINLLMFCIVVCKIFLLSYINSIQTFTFLFQPFNFCISEFDIFSGYKIIYTILHLYFLIMYSNFFLFQSRRTQLFYLKYRIIWVTWIK